MTEVRHNPDEQRYELFLAERRVGFLDYRPQGEAWAFVHTEVEPELRGRGLGSRLVAGALDDVRGRGGHVVPLCWFVAAFIGDNPDYAELVAA
ncbi:MAG: N-acetyltransferase [Thermoleophilia bacterium]|nr:N-acetyltransferase [Thermoleophilia bacterium]